MGESVNPVRTETVNSGATARPNRDPAGLALRLLNEHGGAKNPDFSELRRKLDAIRLQDAALGQEIRAELEKLLTPVQRGQLAAATYMQNGVKIVPDGKSLAEQFKAPAGSADRANYDALDKRYGDGNLRTDDSARIQQKINEQITSGLPLDKFLAQERAVEKDWLAKSGDFLANFSPAGLVLEAAQPAIAELTRGTGLGNSEWGAHLQRVLDTPGSARALNAGLQEGMLRGAKDFVVGLASIAGKAIQYSADNSPGGFVGDAARRATPDVVKGWLRDIGVGGAIDAVVPSAQRGYENTQKLAETGKAIGDYFANRTPGQVAEDVKAKIGQMWDSIKADHAKAKAQGPQAEARWWGQIIGRATFEVASTFVPVAGVAGKMSKTAQVADKVSDAVRVTDKVADAVRTGDKAADAVRTTDKIEDGLRAGDSIADTKKASPGVSRFSDDIIEQSRLTGIPPEKIKEILDTPKGSRPNPSDYMSKAAIDAHLKPFEEGAVRIQPSAPTGTIGRTETWVFPKSKVDDAVKQAGGDPRKLEALLGLDNGYLGSNPVRVDIPNPQNARIPTGNEFGANNFWRPGGYTYPGKMPEAIIDPVPAGSYTSKPVF